jgi:hypothetical protein
MGITTKKYCVSVSFCPKLPIFAKTVGYHLWIFSEYLSFSKSHKNSYIELLCITYPQSEDHDQEILSFNQLMPQIGDFC